MIRKHCNLQDQSRHISHSQMTRSRTSPHIRNIRYFFGKNLVLVTHTNALRKYFRDCVCRKVSLVKFMIVAQCLRENDSFLFHVTNDCFCLFSAGGHNHRISRTKVELWKLHLPKPVDPNLCWSLFHRHLFDFDHDWSHKRAFTGIGRCLPFTSELDSGFSSLRSAIWRCRQQQHAWNVMKSPGNVNCWFEICVLFVSRLFYSLFLSRLLSSPSLWFRLVLDEDKTFFLLIFRWKIPFNCASKHDWKLTAKDFKNKNQKKNKNSKMTKLIGFLDCSKLLNLAIEFEVLGTCFGISSTSHPAINSSRESNDRFGF